MSASDDILESAKPPKPPRPPRPYDVERRTSLLLHLIAVATVATAAFAGITAWETHQDRVFTKTLYCGFTTSPDSGADPQQDELADRLGC